MGLFRQSAKYLFAAVDRLSPSPSGPRILIYHEVGLRHGMQLEVTREDFCWQLGWLLENRSVVSLETALQGWSEVGSDDQVVLTFDDGYRGLYTSAFPALQEAQVPFTIYISTEMIGTNNGGWDALTWNQLEEMLESRLVTLGAHTHSHADLRDLNAPQIAYEIETSNAILMSRLGLAPRHFAYPWGYWDKSADQVVRDTYSSAVLGALPLRRVGEFDPFKLHRVPIQLSDSRRWFVDRLQGGLALEEEVRRLLRGYRGP